MRFEHDRPLRVRQAGGCALGPIRRVKQRLGLGQLSPAPINVDSPAVNWRNACVANIRPPMLTARAPAGAPAVKAGASASMPSKSQPRELRPVPMALARSAAVDAST